MKRQSHLRFKIARTVVAIIGARALPANLAEFRKPMTFPSDSDTKTENTSGRVAAMKAV